MSPIEKIDRRFKYIIDDVQKFIDGCELLGIDLNQLDDDSQPLVTHLFNIKTACDLNNDESDQWLLKSENK